MNDERDMLLNDPQDIKPLHPRRWAGPVIFLLAAAVVVLLGLLATSIMERRWESQRPSMVLQPIADWEPDNAVWGRNYPNEYDSYLRTRLTGEKTKYGGSSQKDYLEEDPQLCILFAGFGFGKEYKQPRGHYYAVQDVSGTKRIKPDVHPGTCWTCKSTDVPRLMDKMGVKEFYAANFHDLKKDVTHPIGCQDCHDPKTMNLRITRPALKEGLAAMGKSVDQATHQEMRSLVCAQCHVNYYFKTEPKNYLRFPWKNGLTVENALADLEESSFVDFVHPISKTPILKARHPDYEIWSTSVHAFRGVSCADCHMPYRTEGGTKFTDHHVQSPLLNIANSCAVCHRWSEAELRTRVEFIQDKVHAARLDAEDALVKAHFDVAAAMQAGVSESKLVPIRRFLRHAQFRWDFVAANNGMGFHSPQECMRILGNARAEAQQCRVTLARLMAEKGIMTEPAYPDISTREKAAKVAAMFVEGKPPKLLP